MPAGLKVIALGLDGLEPSIVGPMLASGELPNLARLRDRGGYSTVGTTTPAQTPVAWSTFATGVNPGGHGVFDFLRRDPRTRLPDSGLVRFEKRSVLLPPAAVNLRRGRAIWDRLTALGIPSTVLRCPGTFPPDQLNGCMLAGMGVPDLRGGFGTSTFYTSEDRRRRGESEQVVRLVGEGDTYRTHVIGPRDASGGDITSPVTIEIDDSRRGATLRSAGEPRTLQLTLGQWSPWLRMKFRTGPLASVRGLVRFLLLSDRAPVELYASPVNFDHRRPLFPISHPLGYAGDLADAVGLYHTTGLVEDHNGLTNGRFGEAEFLDHCEEVLLEREKMMMHELDRFNEGFFFCLFDTPDRVQHMFWRFREPDHPANKESPETLASFSSVIEDHMRKCDAIVGRMLERADDRTLVIVLSDHGFCSFQRGVHVNTWLVQNGFLALKPGASRGEEGESETADFFHQVDWGRTQAYALGFGGIYVNARGRETDGTVAADDVERVAETIARGITGLADSGRGGGIAVARARTRRELYAGTYASESPDVVVDCSRGYRVSFETALGGIPRNVIDDNVRPWGGDHIVDADLVPGVLFMNRPFRGEGARLTDLAPTILHGLGAPGAADMEGASLLT